MPGYVIRRPARPKETSACASASAPSEAVPVTQETTRPTAGNRQGSGPKRFNARALRNEIVGEMRRYGADPSDIATSRPEVWETRADWEEILP